MNTEERFSDGTGKTRKLRRLQLFRFIPGDSFLHRLDPRTKLFLLLAVSVVTILFNSLAVLLLLFLFELLLAVTSGFGKKFLRALSLVSPLLILVIILDSLFSKTTTGTVWFSGQVGFLHPEITTGSMIFAAAMGFRLLNIAGISVLFIMSTSHDDFIHSLRGMGIPPTLAFSLGYALRSITSLTDDTRQIMDSQRSRGLELDRGNITGYRNKLTALFIPVTVSLLNRSKNTADAMQARGFRQSATQSIYKPGKFDRPDFLMGIILAALVIALFALNRISAV